MPPPYNEIWFVCDLFLVRNFLPRGVLCFTVDMSEHVAIYLSIVCSSLLVVSFQWYGLCVRQYCYFLKCLYFFLIFMRGYSLNVLLLIGLLYVREYCDVERRLACYGGG